MRKTLQAALVALALLGTATISACGQAGMDWSVTVKNNTGQGIAHIKVVQATSMTETNPKGEGVLYEKDESLPATPHGTVKSRAPITVTVTVAEGEGASCTLVFDGATAYDSPTQGNSATCKVL